MEDFASGFPPPPFFYKNYSFRDGDPLHTASGAHFTPSAPPLTPSQPNIGDGLSNELISGPVHPAAPSDIWYAFGNQEGLSLNTVELDSETLIRVSVEDTDVRVHLKALYKDFMDSLLSYLDRIKNMDSDSISEIKRFMKLYSNIQHTLSSFSQRKAEDDVVRMLRDQLQRRRHYIDCLKV
ncbi:RNA polymerase II mediator complex MED7 [Babesia ovata]|uniref:Mediator of RNA polymerase II transcription subunit 7 n=1 Tax=Babesia ovata TaxID=189622 RepID=A0A2H6KC27_9APIC|nr:RNA polymerase II mediator complex MED7 [Babesia ovata]GBE60519.1 RNA polymerase II mediator complex MED7 [Babesia ovata]